MNLEMIRGTSDSFNVKVLVDGKPYTLTSGEVLVFGIKYRPYQATPALVKTVTAETDGVYTVTLKPKDTIGLKYGDYFYQVNIQSGDDFFPVVDGKFKVKANATKWGDGA